MPPSEPPRSSKSKRRKPPPPARPLASKPPKRLAPASEPKVRIPKPKAKPLQAQPPRTYAPAAEPSVKITRPQRPQAPTPTQVQQARTQRAQIESSHKASAAAAYRAAPVAKRRQIVAKAKATPVAQRTPAQNAALSVHHGRAAGTAAERASGFGQTHQAALAQRAAILSSAAAVTSAAKIADKAAAKVKQDKPKPVDGGIKVGGVSFKPAKILKDALRRSSVPGIVASPYAIAKAATATPPGLKEAPAETALKQTQRGAYSLKAVVNDHIKRHGLKDFLIGMPRKESHEELKATRKHAVRGFQLKEKTSGADILKTAGVKNKYVRGAGGVAIDFAAEGATTPGFGVGSVGARAAARAGRTAERAALKAGAEKAAARAAGRRAASRVVTPAEAARAARTRAGAVHTGPLPKAQQKVVDKAVRRATTRAKREAAGRGVAVRYAGHEIPGSRRATAAVGRAARKVAKKPAKTRAERAAEHKTEHAIRTARVEKQAAHAEANRVTAAAHASLRTDEERAAVAHALDTGRIRDLTPSWEKALKKAGKERKKDPSVNVKARAQQIMEKDHPDEVRLARAATRLRSEGLGVHVAERQANMAERTDPENFLTKGDHKKLKSTVEKAQRAAQRQVDVARGKVDVAPGQEQAGKLSDKLARREALQGLPQKGRGRGVPITETDIAYLKRLHAYADYHGLKLIHRRAGNLLAHKAPSKSDVAGGYYPRVTEEAARKQLGIAEPKRGTGSMRTGTARTTATRQGGKARQNVRPLGYVQAERAAAGEPQLTENPALAFGARVRQGREAVAESNFARNLADTGRTVTHENQVRDGEELYYLGRSGGKNGKYGLHPADKVAKKGNTPRRYVAMPKGAVDRATAANQAVPKFDNRGLRAFDKLTSGYKGIITRNPVFHLKNAIGDIHRLVFEVPAGGKIRSTVGAAKTARAVRQIERFQAGGKAPSAKALGAKINLGGGETVTAQQLAARLKRHGMIDAGRSMQEQFERELLTGQGAKEANILRANAKSVRGGLEAALNPTLLTQETPNTIRASAWIAGKRMGMSDGDAADFSHQFFVDYGKLTPGERQVGRRILPFYTWTRQALPATLANFAKNPARYGNMEAVRTEWNQMMTGLTEDELDARMSKFARRNLPFVIPIGHDAKGNPQFKAVSASWAVTLLNNLPTSTSATDLARGAGETGQTVIGMLNPLIRTPAELTSMMAGRGGHKLGTDQAIEDPYNPADPAPVPEWIKHLPPSLKRELRVTTIEDPKTGKKVLGWRGKADYGYKQLPSIARKALDAGYAIEQGGFHRPDQTRPGLTAILGGFGITADEVSQEVAKANARFEKIKRLGELNREQAFLPAGVDKDHPTPKYLRLRAEINKLNKELRPNKPRAGGKLDIGLGGGGGPKIDIGLGGGPKTKVDIGLGG